MNGAVPLSVDSGGGSARSGACRGSGRNYTIEPGAALVSAAIMPVSQRLMQPIQTGYGLNSIETRRARSGNDNGRCAGHDQADPDRNLMPHPVPDGSTNTAVIDQVSRTVQLDWPGRERSSRRLRPAAQDRVTRRRSTTRATAQVMKACSSKPGPCTGACPTAPLHVWARIERPDAP